MSDQQQSRQQRQAHDGPVEEQLRLTSSGNQSQSSDSSFEDLLDQIDAVIDANPAGYVRTFVQRGGQ